MNQQLNLTIPQPMLKRVQQKTKEDGYRSAQEYILQAVRDKWFLENIGAYQAIAKGIDPKKRMSVSEFAVWSKSVRKNSK